MGDGDLKIFKKMKNKQGISDVIATVLIILVTIVAAGALGAFLIPWVQEKMGGATNCLDIQNKISFVQDSSCYYIKPDESVKYTQVRVKFGKVNISEMNLYVEIGDEIRAISIKDGVVISTPEYPVEIRVLKEGIYVKELSLPQSSEERSEERTYKFKDIVLKSIKVAAVVNGKTCDMVEADLDRCRSGG